MENFKRLEWMDYYVTEHTPGVFMLSNDGEVVLDIQRSDTDVYEALKSLVDVPRGIDSKYAYFKVEFANNSFDAYTMHCKIWHRHKHNYETHPRPPAGTDWCCPIDGCECHELANNNLAA